MSSEWTTDEQFHWREASCGREEHRTYKIAHTWYPEITKAATCTAEGERTYICTVCNITRTESIAMTEHSYSTTWKGDASGHWNECIGCGKQENFAEHATKIVTLTSDGERKEICPTCDYGDAPSAWTKETLSELSNALENYAKTNTNAKVKVVGELSEFYFSNILYNFSSKYGSSKQVDIDLSGITGLTKINDMYFRSYTSLASIILPNGITTIGKEAFKGCTSLTSVTLPNDLTTIGDYAFSGCTSLASATLPNGLTTIGKYAFNECTSLASATLPNGLTTILDYTFSGCTSLASITIPDSVTTIWTAAFNKCTSLTNVTLPANITEIRTAVFSGCTNLASITIPKSVTKIGASAFSSCEQLEKVENMEGVTIIDEYAFQSCKSLKTIRFPPSVTEIGRFAFHLSGLETIEFSEGLKKIKSHAFASCRNLMGDIEIPSSVIILEGATAFSDCTSLTRIIFKDTSGWLSGGREVDLSNPVSNAFRLVNSYPASSLIGSDLYKE
ncbi:MAG: leucine-rich repeat protein [Treponema sp.]|nr:leucine-rich repeat protein [Treponema sp.]